MQFQDETFRNKNVELELDGNEYNGCTFENCRLIYRGAIVTKLARCSFPGSVFIFENGAHRTLDFLQILYHGGVQPLIEQLFNNIRAGTMPPVDGTIYS
jgi:hypothetical protein